MNNPLPAVAVVLASWLLACSGDGGRWLLLKEQRVVGLNRICVYADALGEVAVTLRSWQSCAPDYEVSD